MRCARLLPPAASVPLLIEIKAQVSHATSVGFCPTSFSRGSPKVSFGAIFSVFRINLCYSSVSSQLIRNGQQLIPEALELATGRATAGLLVATGTRLFPSSMDSSSVVF